MLSITDLKKDTLIQLSGEPYRVLEYSHTSLGRGGAVVRLKIKNLKTGSVLTKTFKGSDRVEPAQVTKTDVQYLYREGDRLHVMDLTSYDQQTVPAEALGPQARFLTEGSALMALLSDGQIIGLEMGKNAELTVTQTEPGVRGDTATAALKPATLESGATVQVPLFITTGDRIRVDTKTGAYLGRV